MEFGKSLLRALPCVAALAGLTGCGVSPGDTWIYRVSFGETDSSSGCWHPATEPPENLANDSSSLRGTGTWIIYASIEDKIYLDTGAVTLEGAESDEGFTFSGKVVDVEYSEDPSGAETKRTTTITSTVNVITDGNAISGEGIEKRSFACSGSACGDKVPSCTRTSPFVGTYIEDVELKYDIGDGSGAPPSP
ncbi:hypothetical protein [Polyangium jinanense]|uniref:Lipoprotein n=1 Tax=Polyangium jinanense TaxID=2829994 RepID=A0A9X4AU71_9BACT|nr:hypothetical protein [Polyangium jinanense]MDC3956027.1 hypothetical protein [Polyangium jinanense]MDC3982942.1 hypothetical protein [Polyangium jinanense]